MKISKSKYCYYMHCPKQCWLHTHRPELKKSDEDAQNRLAEGNKVGELARGLFGEFINVATPAEGGRLDYFTMIAKTQEALAAGAENICEAAFSKDGLYCAVDILHKENGGYAIYEVKATNSVKTLHYTDVAFQKYLLELCGIKVTGTYLIHLNKDYLRNGNIEATIGKLFKCTDISKKVEKEIVKVKDMSDKAKLLLDGSEPEPVFSAKCTSPCTCDFFEYCKEIAPKPSVLDVYDFNDRWQLYNSGICTFEDLLASGHKLSGVQRRQIEFTLGLKTGIYVDKAGVKSFVDKLSYPLYFLDFESMMPALPPYDGTHTYQQILYQYSLHIAYGSGGKIEHREFLGEPETDPRRALAEQLVKDIPENSCVAVFNKTFEQNRLKELAADFPDLKEHLLNIRDHIVDFLEPFQSGYYYNILMGKSFSVKSVAPAIYPNDPELDYSKLEGIHNGTEAKDVFPKLRNMSPDERERTSKGMLAYCGLDTYSLVKIWQELVRVSK